MEFQSYTSAETVINILEILKDQAANTTIELANYRIQQANPVHEEVDKLIADSREKIDCEIGEGYIEGAATVTGSLYTTDDEGIPDGKNCVVQNKPLIYYGADIQTVRGVPEVVFTFYESNDQQKYAEGIVDNIYYALPEKLSRLDITQPETIDDILLSYSAECDYRLTDVQFLNLPATEQQDYLTEIVTHLMNDLIVYEGVILYRYRHIYGPLRRYAPWNRKLPRRSV